LSRLEIFNDKRWKWDDWKPVNFPLELIFTAYFFSERFL
jgi:hypothetical protein